MDVSAQHLINNEYTEVYRRIPFKLQVAYGVGHVFNDICASMWFTYLLVFFQLVLQFDKGQAGFMLLIGQVADALATPFVGFHSDQSDQFWLCRYGRRKAWHLIGTLCVLVSFPFIFSHCIGCENSNKQAQIFYYCVFIVIFQFGWACVQISHLSLIPELTPNEHDRTKLTAIRLVPGAEDLKWYVVSTGLVYANYAVNSPVYRFDILMKIGWMYFDATRYSFTVISNLLVYVITWAILHINGGDETKVGPADVPRFQHIVWIGISIGLVTSLCFHIFVKEDAVDGSGNVRGSQMRTPILDLLTSIQVYQVAIVYMSTRLFVNLSQVFIPLYLHRTLDMAASSLALIPLVMFLGSFLTSMTIERLNRIFGRKMAYICGVFLGILGCIWIKLGAGEEFKEYQIHIVAVLIGAGGSIILVTSLGITADLIGDKTDSGAFVYGIMSFTDKLANGVAVVIIQDLYKDSTNVFYYRDVLCYVCGGSALLGAVAVITLYRKVRRDHLLYENVPNYNSINADNNPVITDENQQSLIS